MENKMIKTKKDRLGIKEYVSNVAIQDKLDVVNAILGADKIKISVDREDAETTQVTDEYEDEIVKTNAFIDPLSFALHLKSGKILGFDFDDLMYHMDNDDTYISWMSVNDYAPQWCPDDSHLMGFTIEKIC